MVVESITHILKITPDLSDIDYRQPKNDFVPSANKNVLLNFDKEGPLYRYGSDW